MVQFIRIDELSLCLYTQLHTLAPPCGLFFFAVAVFVFPSPFSFNNCYKNLILEPTSFPPEAANFFVSNSLAVLSLVITCQSLQIPSVLQLSKRSSPRESTSSFAGVDNFEFTTDAVLSQSATRTLTAYPDQLNNAIVIACGIIVFIG